MKRRSRIKKWWVISIIMIVILSNLPPLKPYFRFFLDENHYRYSNETGSFTFVEFKAHDIKMMNRRFDRYKSTSPAAHDTIVYRLFKKNPLSFWRWSGYMFDSRYKLPYKSWDEIKKVRGEDPRYTTNTRDF